MIGTLVNAGAIVVGSAAGVALRKSTKVRENKTLIQVMGALSLILALGECSSINSGKKFVVAMLSLLVGGLFGSLLDLEVRFERVASSLRKKLQKKGASNESENTFLQAFLASSTLYCVGPVAILGAMRDALQHDPSLLINKAVLDGCISVAWSASMGIGVLFSAIPVLLYQGALTLGAEQIQSLLSTPMIEGISAAGAMMLVFLSFNLLGVTRIPVLNFLPGLIVVAATAHFVWG